MAVAIMTAGGGHAWEPALVSAADAPSSPVAVSRRCTDMADVLAHAATGLVRAAVIAADLRRLDTESVALLTEHGVAVIAVCPAQRPGSEARVARIGIRHSIADDVAPAAMIAAVTAAVHESAAGNSATPAGGRPADAPADDQPADALAPEMPGAPEPAGAARLDAAAAAGLDRAVADPGAASPNAAHAAQSDPAVSAPPGDMPTGPSGQPDSSGGLDLSDSPGSPDSSREPATRARAAADRRGLVRRAGSRTGSRGGTDDDGRRWGRHRRGSLRRWGRSPAPTDHPDPQSPGQPAAPERRGTVIAVWGPGGAPGRTTVALGMADQFAAAGVRALLIDADVYGGLVANALGLLDESPGLAGVCRLAANGTLDADGFAAMSWTVGDSLTVLTGIARADRWPEVRPSAIPAVLDVARRLADVVVVDCAALLEIDEELSFDTMAPRRNGATVAILAAADAVVAVGSADPAGMERLVRGLAELTVAVDGINPIAVLNRVRPTAADPGELSDALRRFSSVAPAALVPEDRAACDRAWRDGALFSQIGSGSDLVGAFAGLARLLHPTAGPVDDAAPDRVGDSAAVPRWAV